MGFDLVVRGGTVVDGSGMARYRADVGVVGGRIVSIGRIRERGASEIDAEGHFVAPGFIDPHTHLDAQVCWDPLATTGSWHGVTTVVMGNCGFSVAPCGADKKDLVLRSFERAEDIPREVVLAGIDWRWETFAEYLAEVERLPKGVNFAAQVGHCALRTYAMGERAFSEAAGEDDVAVMRRELAAAMRAGAVGFSTTRSPSHATSDGHPVASRVAGWDEWAALVDVLDELNAGAVSIVGRPGYLMEEMMVDYDLHLREVAVSTGRPIIDIAMPVGKSVGGGRYVDALGLWDDICAAGGHALGIVRPKPFSSTIGFGVKLPFDTLPSWKEVRGLSLAEQRAAFSDPARRKRLVDDALHGQSGSTFGAEARPPQYDRLFAIGAGIGPWPSVAELAIKGRTTPVDVIVDLSLATDFQQLFAQTVVPGDFRVVRDMLAHPRTIMAGSDTGAHSAQVIDSDFPTFLLAFWVREHQEFTWEEGVRMLTFDPASVWGFGDRGLVREGYRGDLTIFDPERVGPGQAFADNDLPGGAKRLKQRADGIRSVVVNGREILTNGEPTGELPGQLIRGNATTK